MAQCDTGPSEEQFDRSILAMRSTWQRMMRAEARTADTNLRTQLAAAERRAEAAGADRVEAQRRELTERQARVELQSKLKKAEDALAAAQSDLTRTREALRKQTARAELEQRKFAQLADKLGIARSKNLSRGESRDAEQVARTRQSVKRARESAPPVSPGHSTRSSTSIPVPQTRDGSDADSRPRVVRRLDDQPPQQRPAADQPQSSSSSRTVSASRAARAGSTDDPCAGDALHSASSQSAPSNMQRLIDAGLLSRTTRVFQGQGAQLARDKYAQAAGHRCMLAYGLPSGAGNCYLSFPDQISFARVYHKMLLNVADPTVRLQPRVNLDDICFYEQLYMPCSWYFDVEEEASGRPLPDLAQQMIAAIREAARVRGINDIGECCVTDGSRASKDKLGYKNSLHLVFSKSPVCPHPTSNAAAPDYPPLLAAQHVHSRMDVKDSKGAKQPDIGVYTTRRNMRLLGSCKVGQPVPLTPVNAFPHSSGFSIQSWVDWLKSTSPQDLLQYMISRDDGVTNLNWQTEPSSGGSLRRVNGAADNWEVLGPAPGGVMSQAAAGLSPMTANRMPPLKAWVNKTNDDGVTIDDTSQDLSDPSRGDGASRISTRRPSDVRRSRGSEEDGNRDRGTGSRGGGAGTTSGSRFYRGNRSNGRRSSDSRSGQSRHSSSNNDRRTSGNSTRSNDWGGGDRSGNSSAGRPQHRSMTRQAFDAPSPSRARPTPGVSDRTGTGRVNQRSGSWSRQQAPQPLAVTTLNPVQQRILRHQNQNGVVRNHSVRAEMAAYESEDFKQYADAMGLSPSSRARLCQDCSRHRAPVPAGGGSDDMLPPAGPPPTPQGYWDTSIPESETQELD